MSINFRLLELTVDFAERNDAERETGAALYDQSHYMMNNDIVRTGSQVDGICATKDSPEKVMEYVEENVCGSTGCIAGWAAIFAGWCQFRRGESYGGGDWYESVSDGVVNPANGDWTDMADAAKRELGLSGDQAHSLFSGSNTIEHIREMVEALRQNEDDDLSRLVTENRPEEPDYDVEF